MRNLSEPVSFFFCNTGLCGICDLGATVGDLVTLMFPGGDGLPMALREDGDDYKTVGAVVLSDRFEDNPEFWGSENLREFVIS